MADHWVLRDMLHYLFVCDEHEFPDDRIRVQLAFTWLIQAYSGCRPGSIVESTQHRGTNDGLLYQDVLLQAERKNGELQYCIAVEFRHRKGRPNEPYVHPLIFLCILIITH